MSSHSGYHDRISDLAERARRERREFTPPADPPDEDRATAYLRDGAGQVVALYIEARTAEWEVAFSERELALLHRALNDWFDLYARCHGVEMESDFTVREAAEILLQTHDICDTAQLLTTVPAR